MSILETAQQLVALNSVDAGKSWHPQNLLLATLRSNNADALAAALVEAEIHMLALINICTDLNVHVDIGEDMNSEELARMYKLKSARAFVSRISKELKEQPHD